MLTKTINWTKIAITRGDDPYTMAVTSVGIGIIVIVMGVLGIFKMTALAETLLFEFPYLKLFVPMTAITIYLFAAGVPGVTSVIMMPLCSVE